MKTKILVLFIFSFSVFSFSQSKNEKSVDYIKKSLTSFVNNIKEKKIDSAVDYIYPRYFEIVSKEKVTQLLNFTYNNPSILMDIQEFKIETVEIPEEISHDYYSIANYSFKLKMKVNWNLIPNSDQVKSKIKDSIEKKYGKDNIKYFPNDDHYIINAKMKSCAISKNETDWTFLIIEPQYKPQLQNILPEKILSKF